MKIRPGDECGGCDQTPSDRWKHLKDAYDNVQKWPSWKKIAAGMYTPVKAKPYGWVVEYGYGHCRFVRDCETAKRQHAILQPFYENVKLFPVYKTSEQGGLVNDKED